jgi:hypothetical protein
MRISRVSQVAQDIVGIANSTLGNDLSGSSLRWRWHSRYNAIAISVNWTSNSWADREQERGEVDGGLHDVVKMAMQDVVDSEVLQGSTFF